MNDNNTQSGDTALSNEENTMNRHLRALELDKVLAKAAERTSCDEARELMLSLRPSGQLDRVQKMLTETSDAHSLSGRFGSPSFGGLTDISDSVRRCKTGASLSASELLEIARVLHVLRTLKDWKKRSEGTKSSLDRRFEAIIPSRYLEDKITGAILSEDEIADSASPELAAIRRKIRLTSSRARDILDKMIRSSVVQKYLQENIITMRNGRFVVPVKAECRGSVPGLVHDTSGSGQTIFVEPMAVVEANNEIKVLESKERDEIARILWQLSAEVAGHAGNISTSCRAAVELDVIFAKADLAYKM
ncbi:MAG: endonuclease MutS2, partial [Clostridia bacterium]|nr:endonuclease MutS2 [Clostridia bacterium]